MVLQTALERALTCTLALRVARFGIYSAQHASEDRRHSFTVEPADRHSPGLR